MDLIKGETVIIRQEYDLFDNQMEGREGLYIKTDKTTGKHLIYFPQIGEWGEVDNVERIEERVIQEKNKNLVSRIKTLEYNADEKLRVQMEKE